METADEQNSSLNHNLYNNVSDTDISTNNDESNNQITILGLNVCGLKSKLRNGIFEEYIKDHSIICLSETKVSSLEMNTIILHGYSCIVKENILQNNRYGGVHGLCMFIKEDFFSHTFVLKEMSSPYILWVRFGKDAFGLECVIGGVYLPCLSSKYKDADMFNQIYDDIINIKANLNVPICMIGDFNARTSNKDDSLQVENEILNQCNLIDIVDEIFPDNLLEDISEVDKIRVNEDAIMNKNGEMLIDMCNSLNFKIVNGRLGLDKGIGAYTFHSPSGSSTIDYSIVSTDFFPYLSNFEVDILDQNLSDFHCPIILSLNCQSRTKELTTSKLKISSDINYTPTFSKWDNEKRLDYQNYYEPDEFRNLISILDRIESDGPNQSNIDIAVKEICKLYLDPAIALGISKKITAKTKSTV